jgi:hypothetical protein
MRRPSPDAITAVGLALACTALYALCGGGRFFSVDEVAAFQLTRLWLEGEPIASSHVTWAGPDGRAWNVQGPLLSVAAVPGYLFGRVLGLLLPASWAAAIAGPELGNLRGVLWGGDMRIVGASLTNAWVTGAIVALLFLWLRSLGIARGVALLTAVVAAFATLLCAHSKNLFSHTLETLGLLGAVLALGAARARPSVRGFAVAGAWAAALVLTRVQAAVTLPALVAYAWWAAGPERRLARVATFAGVAALGPLLFAAWNLYRFRSLTEMGYTSLYHFSFDVLEPSYGHLFSVGRSLFIYSPPVALALLGWPEVLRRHRAEGLLVLGASGGLFLLYVSWSGWHGAWCFGNRFLLPTVPLLLVGLPYILPGRPSLRACALGIVVGAGLVVQTLGLAVHIAFIHHAYGYAEHPAPLPYLFVPSQSQLATHADALWRGYALDPWLLRLASDVGVGAALALALPVALAAAAGAMVMYCGPRWTDGGAGGSRGPVPARRRRRERG